MGLIDAVAGSSAGYGSGLVSGAKKKKKKKKATTGGPAHAGLSGGAPAPGGSAPGGYPSGGGAPSPAPAASSVSRAPVATTSTGRYTRPSPPPQARAGQIKEVKPPPPPPSIKEFLGDDPQFQSQLRNFSKAMSDFRSDLQRRRGTLRSDAKQSRRALGEQRVEDLEGIEEDFAGRGLIRSGLYGDAVGDYEEEYGERLADLKRRLQQSMEALGQEKTKFKGSQRLKRQEARQEAIRRRAEEYGL